MALNVDGPRGFLSDVLYPLHSCASSSPLLSLTTTYMLMSSQALPSSLLRGVHSVATCLLNILLVFHENLKLSIGKT